MAVIRCLVEVMVEVLVCDPKFTGATTQVDGADGIVSVIPAELVSLRSLKSVFVDDTNMTTSVASVNALLQSINPAYTAEVYTNNNGEMASNSVPDIQRPGVWKLPPGNQKSFVFLIKRDGNDRFMPAESRDGKTATMRALLSLSES